MIHIKDSAVTILNNNKIRLISGELVVISGDRQLGKTTTMKSLMSNMYSRGTEYPGHRSSSIGVFSNSPYHLTPSASRMFSPWVMYYGHDIESTLYVAILEFILFYSKGTLVGLFIDDATPALSKEELDKLILLCSRKNITLVITTDNYIGAKEPDFHLELTK